MNDTKTDDEDPGIPAILFTTEAEMEEVAIRTPWLPNMEEADWFQAVGYERVADEIGEGSKYGTRLAIRYRVGKKRPEAPWFAMVSITDEFAESDWDLFVVMDRIALLRLKTYLTSRVAYGTMSRIDELCSIAARAFEAWHGHAHTYPCKKCDAHEHRMDMLRDAQRAEMRAAEAARLAEKPLAGG